jgi:hypothetical protein
MTITSSNVLSHWECDEPDCDASESIIGVDKPSGWVRARSRVDGTSKGFDVALLWTVYCPRHNTKAKRIPASLKGTE